MKTIALVDGNEVDQSSLLKQLGAIIDTDSGDIVTSFSSHLKAESRIVHFANVALVLVSCDKPTNNRGWETAIRIKHSMPEAKVFVLSDEADAKEKAETWGLDNCLPKRKRLTETLPPLITTLGIKLKTKGNP